MQNTYSALKKAAMPVVIMLYQHLPQVRKHSYDFAMLSLEDEGERTQTVDENGNVLQSTYSAPNSDLFVVKERNNEGRLTIRSQVLEKVVTA